MTYGREQRCAVGDKSIQSSAGNRSIRHPGKMLCRSWSLVFSNLEWRFVTRKSLTLKTVSCSPNLYFELFGEEVSI
jgi:hypothetical protein